GDPQAGRRGRADVEELVGEGLVGYAAQQKSPAALALLSGIACLGTPRQAARAEAAALAMMEHGVARPGWSEHVGAVAAAECYVNSDIFGDRDEVVCVFSYAGEEPHALVMVVDYNAGGMLRDGWVTSQVDKLLERCRDASAAAAGETTPGDSARRDRSRCGSGGQRLVRVLSRVSQGEDPHAPARRALPAGRGSRDLRGPRIGVRRAAGGGHRLRLGRCDRPAARVDQGPPGHAGGRVPRLR